YLTAIDFQVGETVYKRMAGEGFGFNNNYAPITIGPDASIYVGALGGMVLLRDKVAPTAGGSAPASPVQGNLTSRPLPATGAGPAAAALLAVAGALAARRLRHP
ncbi:MAG: hypothetical protein WDA71_14280, partial [Actinomycetota bacterium]